MAEWCQVEISVAFPGASFACYLQRASFLEPKRPQLSDQPCSNVQPQEIPASSFQYSEGIRQNVVLKCAPNIEGRETATEDAVDQARRLAREHLLDDKSGEPRGPGPDNGKLIFQQWPNHAHEYNQSDSGLAFLLGKQHTLVRKNT